MLLVHRSQHNGRYSRQTDEEKGDTHTAPCLLHKAPLLLQEGMVTAVSPGDSVHSQTRVCRQMIFPKRHMSSFKNLVNLFQHIVTEFDIDRTDIGFNLLHSAGADERTGHIRLAQHPRQCKLR